MSHDQAIQLRSKIMGVLLRDARLSAGKSLKQVGQVIGLSSGTISAVERGSNALSLPELEVLAFYLGIPITRFWNEEVTSQDPHPSENLEVGSLLSMRHRTVAAMLRQGRQEKNLSQKELAQRTSISPSRIRRYESGETPVPLPELENLAAVLGYNLEDFADSSGPVGEWITRKRAEQQFEDLPKHLKEFIANPDNRGYIELAERFSSMSMERLKALAEILNDLVS